MSIFKPPQKNLLSVEVMNRIIDAIAVGELNPGDHITEQYIAAKMEISRAPIREAIRELASQGIIRLLPRKGAYIAPLFPQDIKEAYILRSCLEGLAAELATKRLTREDLMALESFTKKMEQAAIDDNSAVYVENDLKFHDLIAERSGHYRLIKMIEGVRVQTRLLMSMSKCHSISQTDESSHQLIIEALNARNAELAEQRMRQHIRVMGNRLLNHLEAN